MLFTFIITTIYFDFQVLFFSKRRRTSPIYRTCSYTLNEPASPVMVRDVYARVAFSFVRSIVYSLHSTLCPHERPNHGLSVFLGPRSMDLFFFSFFIVVITFFYIGSKVGYSSVDSSLTYPHDAGANANEGRGTKQGS